MRVLHRISLVLVIIGAINWGLWGLFQFDLVATLGGGQSAPFSRVVYSLVGLAGLALAMTSSMPSTSPRAAGVTAAPGRS
jgi:uncharacterized membrane protein YuzA (DUF378 family)